jgi:serine/threonine protein kinase
LTLALAPALALGRRTWRSPSPSPSPRPGQEDLEEHAILGTGTFGKVKLVKHRPTGNTYALKVGSKACA